MSFRQRLVGVQIELDAVHPRDGELIEVCERRCGSLHLRGHQRLHDFDRDGAHIVIRLYLSRHTVAHDRDPREFLPVQLKRLQYRIGFKPDTLPREKIDPGT